MLQYKKQQSPVGRTSLGLMVFIDKLLHHTTRHGCAGSRSANYTACLAITGP